MKTTFKNALSKRIISLFLVLALMVTTLPMYSVNVSAISYSTMTLGNYYLKNKATGEYMAVAYKKDANEQNVHTWDTPNGEYYTIKSSGVDKSYFLYSSVSTTRPVNAYADSGNIKSGTNVNIYNYTGDSTQRWKFEAVSGGYIIHSEDNPNCVIGTSYKLDTGCNCGYQIQINAYSKDSKNIWELIPVN